MNNNGLVPRPDNAGNESSAIRDRFVRVVRDYIRLCNVVALAILVVVTLPTLSAETNWLGDLSANLRAQWMLGYGALIGDDMWRSSPVGYHPIASPSAASVASISSASMP